MAESQSGRRPLRVLLVDDQKLMREGLRMLLEAEPALTVAAEAADGAQAVELYEELQPDVVLMDIRMPVMDGVEATRRIREGFPDAKVLVLTTFEEDELVYRSIRAGARGYLLKDVTGENLAAAIRSVASGAGVLAPSVARKVLDAFSNSEEPSPESNRAANEPLTGRERAVLRLLAEGFSNKEIAARLFLVEGTVRNHVSSILQKLDVRDRTQAALKARELGILGT
jgi:DNA-binding NarL/FixJ family response regulator